MDKMNVFAKNSNLLNVNSHLPDHFFTLKVERRPLLWAARPGRPNILELY